MKREVFHITYDRDDARWITWDVTGKKSKLLRRSFTKAAALRYAVMKARSSRHLGQVVVHGTDGRIQQEMTYGADPIRTKG